MPARRAGHRRPPRLAAALLVLLAVLVGAAPAPAAEPTPPVYAPPVDAPVVDPWRPPPHAYGPGNRGVDYGTAPGDPVRAAAPGTVAFAGSVGGHRHVVVLHDDGLRTSYAFLRAVEVARGDRVEGGQVVGVADGPVHVGVRAGDRYLDPLLLFGATGEVHLVPSPEPLVASEAEERRRLAELVAAAAARSADALAWVAAGAWGAGDAAVASSWDALGALAGGNAAATVAGAVAAGVGGPSGVAAVAASGLAGRLPVVAAVRSLRDRAALVEASQRGCTPPERPAPRPAGRRIAVLVGGIGSASGDASILELDTAALGYADGDVAQFSYRGGRAPGTGALTGVPTSRYDARDASGDLAVVAGRLRRLLVALERAHPGVPIDVLAHSQGGLVARAALDGGVGAPTAVANLVTLGTPHDGADLASAGVALRTTRLGRVVDGIVELGSGGAIDADSPAVAQLAEGSPFLDDLAAGELAAGVRHTSIAARGDLVVPALHSAVAGATNVLLPLDGPLVHGALPGDERTTREVALALVAAGPTCRAPGGDVLVAATIGLAEDVVGAAATAVARGIDGAPLWAPG